MNRAKATNTIFDWFSMNEDTGRLEVALARKRKAEESREEWQLLEESGPAKVAKAAAQAAIEQQGARTRRRISRRTTLW